MNRSSAPLVGADWCAIAVGGGGGGARGGSGRSALTWILRNRSVNVDWMSRMRSSNISKASRLYSTSGSFCPHARYWIAFRSWSRSYRWSFHRSSSTVSITCDEHLAVHVGDPDRPAELHQILDLPAEALLALGLHRLDHLVDVGRGLGVGERVHGHEVLQRERLAQTASVPLLGLLGRGQELGDAPARAPPRSSGAPRP